MVRIIRARDFQVLRVVIARLPRVRIFACAWFMASCWCDSYG